MLLRDLFSKGGLLLSEEPAPSHAPNWGTQANLNVGKIHPPLKGGKWEGGEAAGPGKGKVWSWAAAGRVAGEGTPRSCSWQPGQSAVAPAVELLGWACSVAASLSLLSANPHWTRSHVFASLEACWLYSEMARASEMPTCGYMGKKKKEGRRGQSVALLWWVLKGEGGTGKD